MPGRPHVIEPGPGYPPGHPPAAWRSGAAPFIGADFPGLIIDVQANMTGANMVLNGANIVTVGDAAFTQITQPIDAKRRVLVGDDGDGLASMTTTGIDEFYSSVAIGITSFTIYSIWSLNATGFKTFYKHRLDANNVIELGLQDDKLKLEVARGGTLSAKSGTVALSTGVYFLSAHTYIGIHSSHEVYLNAALMGTSGAGSDPGVAEITAAFFVGTNNSGAGFVDAEHRAFLLYSPAHSTANRDGVTAGLNAFWKVF